LSPFPGAWTEMPIGGGSERVKLLGASLAEASGEAGTIVDDALTIACGEGAVRISELQRAGGKAMRAEEFLRGVNVPKGARLG
jgi:methionyl-tRNA formyltransferase